MAIDQNENATPAFDTSSLDQALPPVTFKLRNALNLPHTHHDGGESIPKNSYHNVHFLHPGCPDRANVIMILPALDSALSDDETSSKWGIHHATALTACAIVANNCWDGFLSRDQKGQDKVSISPDGVLLESAYYFQVPNYPGEGSYPIVHTFDDWEFPLLLPPYWQSLVIPPAVSDSGRASTMENAIISRDQTCRITNRVLATEKAHLIPVNCFDWFERNLMALYLKPHVSSGAAMNSPANGILLRRDVHLLFNRLHFAIIPKGGLLAAHVLYPDAHMEVAELYHNVPLHNVTGVSKHYVFAQFAKAVFQRSAFYFEQQRHRSAITFNTETEKYEEKQIKPAKGNTVRRSPTKRSNSSPQKRQRTPEAGEAEAEDWEDSVTDEGHDSDGSAGQYTEDEYPFDRSQSQSFDDTDSKSSFDSFTSSRELEAHHRQLKRQQECFPNMQIDYDEEYCRGRSLYRGVDVPDPDPSFIVDASSLRWRWSTYKGGFADSPDELHQIEIETETNKAETDKEPPAKKRRLDVAHGADE